MAYLLVVYCYDIPHRMAYLCTMYNRLQYVCLYIVL
jgi:hypothetical protein